MKRISNIELLRILAIIGITFYHNRVWELYSFDSITTNVFLIDSLSMFGKIGVNLFVLITGYYSCIGIQLVSPIFFDILGGRFASNSRYLVCGNSVTSIIISILLIMVAVKDYQICSKHINIIATICFPAYLVQEHIMFRPIMWQSLFKVASFQYSRYLILILFAVLFFCIFKWICNSMFL